MFNFSKLPAREGEVSRYQVTHRGLLLGEVFSARVQTRRNSRSGNAGKPIRWGIDGGRAIFRSRDHAALRLEMALEA